MDDESFFEANRDRWDELAELHPHTDYYDVDRVLDGGSSLEPIEREELPELDGLSVLHLQCHFGLDTLSLAREGAAEVVGVDFSEPAIETARDLRDRTDLADRVEFVRSDVYDVPDRLDREFDLAFTSYGVLYWLPGLDRWAEVVADALRPGGTFYIVEIHPFTACFESIESDGTARLLHPYSSSEALRFDDDGSYADPSAKLESTERFEWAHSMGEIVTALANAGLSVEFLHEFSYTTFPQFDSMVEVEDGRWEIPGLEHEVPLLFSLQARLDRNPSTKRSDEATRRRTGPGE